MSHPTSRLNRAVTVADELHRELREAFVHQGGRREEHVIRARRLLTRIGEELTPEPDPQPYRGDGDQFGPERTPAA